MSSSCVPSIVSIYQKGLLEVNWKENSHIRKKIDNVLKDDKIKSTVDRALAKSRDYTKNKPVLLLTPVAISEGVLIAPLDIQ